MKIITFNDIKSLDIKPAVFIKWAEHVIRNKENYNLPCKISIKMDNNIF